MIYLAHCNSYYKIGYTARKPEDRMKSLQTGNPYPVELAGTAPGSQKDEEMLHEFFRHKHVRGEWYSLSPEDVKYILTEWRDPSEYLFANLDPSRLSLRQQAQLLAMMKEVMGNAPLQGS